MRLRDRIKGLVGLLTLVLIQEAHVSSGISRIDFQELVRRSHAILLVGKSDPYIVQAKIKISDSLPEEFTTTSYNFEIKSVVKSSIDIPAGLRKISVHSASDENNLADTKVELEGGPRYWRIHNRYESTGNQVEDQPEFLIFIRYNEVNNWYSFTAGGAMESKEMADKIHAGDPSNPKPSNPSNLSPSNPKKGTWFSGWLTRWFGWGK